MNRLPRGVECLLRAGLPADQREPIAADLGSPKGLRYVRHCNALLESELCFSTA